LRTKRIQVFLRGGLGNQLFQYAFGLHLSNEAEKELILRSDLLPLGEDQIAGVSRWPNQLETFSHSGGTFARTHQPPKKTNLFGKIMQAQRMLGDHASWLLESFGIYAAENRAFKIGKPFRKKICFINGYASTSEYALLGRDQLLNEVKSLRAPSSAFQNLEEEAILLNPVMVHVRLGDYVALSNIYGELRESYFAQAIDLLEAKGYPVWIFTQDATGLPEPLLKALRPQKIIDSSLIQAPIENLIMMSLGRALICSNSTLSWWAAFLHRHPHQIVAPFFPDKTSIFTGTMTLDGWRVLDVNL